MEVDLRSTDKEKIQGAYDTYQIMQSIFFKRHGEVDTRKEHFWAIALNKALKILSIELISIGTSTKTLAGAKETLSLPIHKLASQVVLVHNHPSGNPEPSENDIKITEKLMRGAILFDIDIVDHVIVAPQTYYSFANSGLIEKLYNNMKYASLPVQEKWLEKEAQKMKREFDKNKGKLLKEGEKKGIEKGAKAEKMQIAKNLLKQGVDVAIVKKTTGITHQWIGRLQGEIAKENK